MAAIFWASAFIIVYVYLGYPLLLAMRSAAAPRPVRRAAPGADWLPSVSIVLAVHNEARRLPGRLVNLLEQDYPAPLDIIVVSDGSTDDPRRAIEPFAGRVRLMEVPRGGKAAALNAGVAEARGEIVVFADARQRFAPDAVRQLVSSFADPRVGAASGELVLDSEAVPGSAQSTVGEGVGLYWQYEKWLRRQESRLDSTLGATGAIYAIRRALWRPLPPETLLDDVLTPMRVVLGGKRVVFNERAQAFDCAAADSAAEVRRKTRTLAGNYQILALEPRLALPFANRVWWQYVSHKLGRLVVPWALIAALVSAAVLAPRSWFYALALILQLGFYGLAAMGAWMERERPGFASETATAADPRRTRSRKPGLPTMSGETRV
jgi:cellulose synthase/poly-beta-1,6-N-acetylglucosamine synthase-like glycosyltransferase